MLKFTPPTENRPAAQAELRRRIRGLDEWQARLVLSFIDTLFPPEKATADEMEVAA